MFSFHNIFPSFLVGIISSAPIFNFIIKISRSNLISFLLIIYWPLMFLIYSVTENFKGISGDGEIFYIHTKLFVEKVFLNGDLWPGFDFFIQNSILYWFTMYFYSIPYYVFGEYYPSIFMFNCFLLVLVSIIFFNLVYNLKYDLKLSILCFTGVLFYFGYWSHNASLERDVVILLQLMIFAFVLKQFQETNKILAFSFILILFIIMSGSRPEFLLVYILMIGANFIDKSLLKNIKNFVIIFLLIFSFNLIFDVFTPAGGIGKIGMRSLVNGILTFPIRVFYAAVGAFPWTRGGIIDSLGNSVPALILHIIGTVYRIIILLATMKIFFDIFLKKYKIFERNNYQIWLYYGSILISTIQFSSLGYTRYLEPSLVAFLPLAMTKIKNHLFHYLIFSLAILAFAHYFYYVKV
jgi:hypothetical protein